MAGFSPYIQPFFFTLLGLKTKRGELHKTRKVLWEASRPEDVHKHTYNMALPPGPRPALMPMLKTLTLKSWLGRRLLITSQWSISANYFRYGKNEVVHYGLSQTL